MGWLSNNSGPQSKVQSLKSKVKNLDYIEHRFGTLETQDSETEDVDNAKAS